MTVMANSNYTSLALHDNEKEYDFYYRKHSKFGTKSILGNVAVAVVFFALGFGLRDSTSANVIFHKKNVALENGRLPPQSFVPDIPSIEVQFKFPTEYEDTGELGDRLWDDLMPIGSGFLRVPYPRKFDMPASKIMPGDHELAEVYSASVTHQLHCLAVLRHVIMRYEIHDKSRFAGAGHEYHCLDYLRQGVLCAGDTTLDHAEIVVDEHGSDQKSGFTGANATHVCRDWNVIKTFLINTREGNKTGILN